MKTSNEIPRTRRRPCLAPELLEDRMVLSNSQGSTFAIMPAAVTTAGQATSTPFTVSPSLFSQGPHGKITMGIDVSALTPAASAGSNLPSTATAVKPEIVSVTSSTGRMFPVQHTRYYAKIARANHLGHTPTSAVLFTIKAPRTGEAP